jgi:DNA-binding CsgD family transcriptional regulator
VLFEARDRALPNCGKATYFGAPTGGSSSAYRKEGAVETKMRAPINPSPNVDRGLALIDSSWAIVALDRGAATILNCLRDRSEPRESGDGVEKGVLQAVHHAELLDPSFLKHVIRFGIGGFTCRTYRLETVDASLPKPLNALVFERHSEARDTIDEVGARYHLTAREQQALRGLSLGLGTKDLAAEMNIRPSTLLAFLRLIKIKMGVTTRSGILSKILVLKILARESQESTQRDV